MASDPGTTTLSSIPENEIVNISENANGLETEATSVFVPQEDRDKVRKDAAVPVM